MADAAALSILTGADPGGAQTKEAVALAREHGDAAPLARALLGAGYATDNLHEGLPYFAEAGVLAREAGDAWTLAQILGRLAYGAVFSGDPVAARAVAEEGLPLAAHVGNDHAKLTCTMGLSVALIFQGDLYRARSLLSDAVAEARPGRALALYLALLGWTLAYMGEPVNACEVGQASLAVAEDGGFATMTFGYDCLCLAAEASGDADAICRASLEAWQHAGFRSERGAVHHREMADAALAAGDLLGARQHADEAVGIANARGLNLHLMFALLASARVALAAGDAGRSSDDACRALTIGRDLESKIGIIDALECLGALPSGANNDQKAARLLGAADGLRQATGYQRFRLHEASNGAAIRALRAALGDAAFGQAWDEGIALSVDDAVSYALRGRGERNRPPIGWQSLTPAEREVARLIAEGLPNKDIAAQLFISPRTVQTHLTHIYGKLGATSRVQLAQQAARQA